MSVIERGAVSLGVRVALAALVLSCSLDTPREGTRLPVPERVVLVTLDTLRTDHMSAYGYFRETSPFLRRLAERGVLFENAFAAIPVTAPSHSSIFTGLNPYQHGVLGNRGLLDPELLTMARMFKQNGYQTAGFVATGFLKSFRPDFDFFHVNEREVIDRRRRSSTSCLPGSRRRAPPTGSSYGSTCSTRTSGGSSTIILLPTWSAWPSSRTRRNAGSSPSWSESTAFPMLGAASRSMPSSGTMPRSSSQTSS